MSDLLFFAFRPTVHFGDGSIHTFHKPPYHCIQPGLSLVNCTQAVCYEPIRTLDVKPCSDITGSSHPCVGPLFCHSFDFVQHHSSQQRSVRAVHLYWKGTPSSIAMSRVDGVTFAKHGIEKTTGRKGPTHTSRRHFQFLFSGLRENREKRAHAFQ